MRSQHACCFCEGSGRERRSASYAVLAVFPLDSEGPLRTSAATSEESALPLPLGFGLAREVSLRAPCSSLL